jgi:hypothetical protein
MRYRVYLIIILTFLSATSLKTNAQPKDISIILENLYGRILYTNDDSERSRLNDSVRHIIDGYVRSDSILTHRFSNLKYLGQITSPDKLLKIINWNLVLRDGNNKYFCYIIRKGIKDAANRIYVLRGSYRNEPARTDIVYNEKNWYGALYYAIQPFKKDKVTNYVILGIDYGNLLVSRKIIEILSFTPEGEIVFGKNCIVKGNEKKFREVFEYSSESVMTLRIHSRKLIVFDHLVSFSGSQKENPEYYGAEYTYDAYALRKGNWIFTTNVDMKNKKKYQK